MSRAGNYDRHITIFSPDGKLHQIEYALKAVNQCGLTGVCLRGKDSVCMVTQKKVTEKLLDRNYVTSFYKITPKIGCFAIGFVPDCRTVVLQTRQFAAQYKDDNAYDIPVHVLAGKVGKQAQLFTQHAGVRPMACTVLLTAIDDEKGPQLFKCDPSGHYFGYKAAAIGSKEAEASNHLEKILKKTSGQSNEKDTIQEAIDCLQLVLSQDLKATDLEVAVVSGKGDFGVLRDDQVEEHLNQIAEKD